MSLTRRIGFMVAIGLPIFSCLGWIWYSAQPDEGVEYLRAQAVYQQLFPGAEQIGTAYHGRKGGLCYGGSHAERWFWTEAAEAAVLNWYEQQMRSEGWSVAIVPANSGTQEVTGKKPGILTNTELTVRLYAVIPSRTNPYVQPAYYLILNESSYCESVIKIL